MKAFTKAFIALLSLHCIPGHALADEVFVDFEDPVAANANFVGLNQGFYSMDPHGGRGDSGAISTNWYTRQNYKGKSFDFSRVNTSITVSTFFHLSVSDPVSDGYGRTYGEVYLVPSSSELGGNISKAFVQFGSVHPSGGSLSDNIFGGSLAAPGGSFPGFGQNYPPGTFKPGSWYELKVTFTNLGAVIRYEIVIDEYDAGGLGFIKNVAHSTQTTIDSFGLTSDTEVFAGLAFELSGARVVDDFSVSWTSQNACEGMYTQPEVDRLVADAVLRAEASKDLVIDEQRQTIAALEESMSILRAEVEARDALLAEKEAIINQLKDELDDLQRGHCNKRQ